MRQAVKAEKPRWGGVCQLYSLASIEIKKWGLHSSENGGGLGTLYQRLSSVPQLLTSTVTEPCTKELGLMSPPAVETCPNVGATSLESLRLLDASPDDSPSPPRDLPEPRVTTEHTNNKIGELACLGGSWCGQG